MSFQKVIVLFVVIGGALLGWVIDKGISVSLERKRSIESFNECVDNWRLNVQSHYIKTEFSESPILDPSYSGSWVAFEGSSAEALFDHPLLKDSNPARFLLNQLNDLEPVFSRMHRIRIKNPDALSSKDAARLDGVFMPLFQQR